MCHVQLRRAVGATVAIVLATFASPVGAQQTGSISGVVRSAASDSVLSGALVSVEGRLSNAQADAEGRFRIDGLPAGKAKLAGQGGRVHFGAGSAGRPAGGDTAIALRLVPVAVQLAELTVIGTNADLEERRARLAQVPGSVALIESDADPPHPAGEPQGRARLHARRLRAAPLRRGRREPDLHPRLGTAQQLPRRAESTSWSTACPTGTPTASPTSSRSSC